MCKRFRVAGMMMLAAVLPTASPAFGQSEVTSGSVILGTGWGMTLALDGSGFYNDAIRAVLDEAGTDMVYSPQPYKRAKMQFSQSGDGCLYPTDIGTLLRGKEIASAEGYIQTRSLVWVESHLFSRPGTPPLDAFENLKGKVIAYPNGSALPTIMADYGASFMPTTDEQTKARMLMAGRVDFMSGSLPDNIFVFRTMDLPMPAYNPDLPLQRVGVGVVCHDTERNRSFVAAFDAALGRLYESGAMAALYSRAGVEPRFLPAP